MRCSPTSDVMSSRTGGVEVEASRRSFSVCCMASSSGSSELLSSSKALAILSMLVGWLLS